MRDEELAIAFAAAQQGEPWALRVIYDQTAPRVHGYLRSRGATDPEDLTSEVFLAVIPRLNTVTGGPAGLRTLLFSVAHARLVDDARRRSRRDPVALYDPDTDPRRSPSSEDEALALDATERVRELLSVLPDDQRDVLLMRIVGDLSVEQVSVALGRSAGAVKQLQRRGLITLRAHLEQCGVTL